MSELCMLTLGSKGQVESILLSYTDLKCNTMLSILNTETYQTNRVLFLCLFACFFFTRLHVIIKKRDLEITGIYYGFIVLFFAQFIFI